MGDKNNTKEERKEKEGKRTYTCLPKGKEEIKEARTEGREGDRERRSKGKERRAKQFRNSGELGPESEGSRMEGRTGNKDITKEEWRGKKGKNT